MMAMPELTPEARASAAARSVAARQARADVRRGLASGEVRIRDVLLAGQSDDEHGRFLARMRVVDLVSSFRGIGPVRAADMMERIGIAANRRIGGLGIRQADALAGALEARNPELGGGRA